MIDLMTPEIKLAYLKYIVASSIAKKDLVLYIKNSRGKEVFLARMTKKGPVFYKHMLEDLSGTMVTFKHLTEDFKTSIDSEGYGRYWWMVPCDLSLRQ